MFSLVDVPAEGALAGPISVYPASVPRDQ
jgi:hypothetical protein